MENCNNIILIGFMGTGKTTVGKHLALCLNWDFVDTDAEIEAAVGLSIPEIFRREGETGFRALERAVITDIANCRHCVIATGGGAVLNPDNWRALAATGPMIHLYASLDTVLARIGSCENRPLLQGDRKNLDLLWQARQIVYTQAGYVVDTTGKSQEMIVREIVHFLGMGGIDFDCMSKN